MNRIEWKSKETVFRIHWWASPRMRVADEDQLDGYKSRFGFAWWFWLPRVYHQAPCLGVGSGYRNPREVRLIWLCGVLCFDFGKEGIPISA